MIWIPSLSEKPTFPSGHRREPAQGDHSEGGVGGAAAAAQALQGEPRLPVRVHVAAPRLRQLHPPRPQVLQPEHYGLHRIQEQVREGEIRRFWVLLTVSFLYRKNLPFPTVSQ